MERAWGRTGELAASSCRMLILSSGMEERQSVVALRAAPARQLHRLPPTVLPTRHTH